jgi:hypothetical protein
MDESLRKEIKEIVLARLESLDKNSKIMLLEFEKPLSVNDLIKEVKNDSKFGKKVVEVQYTFLKMLASGEI